LNRLRSGSDEVFEEFSESFFEREPFSDGSFTERQSRDAGHD
jgi:hypothetical protein